MTLRYDLGDGEQVRTVSPRAMVAWELATKSKVTQLAEGMAVGDLVTMLFEQMKVDGDAPPSRADLLQRLVDIDPVPETPPPPVAEVSPE